MTRSLNIITFDVPYPPDYGGVIDVFNRLKQLKKSGFSIILHCFDYNDRAGESNIQKLKEYCEEVFVYSRKKSFFFLLSRLPFIVISRRNEVLLENLLQNDYPILFEGIHTTAFLSYPELKHRFKVLRTHNIESEYYNHLAKSTHRFLRGIFFKIESRKLRHYEPKILSFAQRVLAISEKDKRYFEKLNSETVILLPIIDFEQVTTEIEAGEKFILFHGNLSVDENEKAAFFLLEKVFSKIQFPVIIAGKNPSMKLQKVIAKYSQVSLVQSPNETKMQTLIASAHIHILYSFQNIGVKLKLMNVLQNGKFCIANDLMVADFPVRNLLTVANDPAEIIADIDNEMGQEFDHNLIENRRLFLFEVHQKAEEILKNVFLYDID